jgi:hypothetical protein
MDPSDYRTAITEQKFLVESAHFSKENELLIRAPVRSGLGPISIARCAFPNHARALKSMMELHFREKTDPPPFMRYTVDCWFNRAFRFAPDDPQVRQSGIYLMRKGQESRRRATRMAGAGGWQRQHQYNLGLAYLRRGI